MKLRFLISHCRKNSVRDKVIGKTWIYSERNTLHRQECGPLSSDLLLAVWISVKALCSWASPALTHREE